jgi:hypothetical protein
VLAGQRRPPDGAPAADWLGYCAAATEYWDAGVQRWLSPLHYGQLYGAPPPELECWRVRVDELVAVVTGEDADGSAAEEALAALHSSTPCIFVQVGRRAAARASRMLCRESLPTQTRPVSLGRCSVEAISAQATLFAGGFEALLEGDHLPASRAAAGAGVGDAGGERERDELLWQLGGAYPPAHRRHARGPFEAFAEDAEGVGVPDFRDVGVVMDGRGDGPPHQAEAPELGYQCAAGLSTRNQKQKNLAY